MEKSLILILTFSASWAWVREMENDGLYQGDMVLNPEQMQTLKHGVFGFGATTDKLWPTTIAYEYSDEIAASPKAVAAIQAAIKDYHHYTCLRFVERTNEENFLHFYKGGGCSSPVGMNGGANRISLAEGCWARGTTIHEIAHSLGFHHEQSRPDRDHYIKIHLENINPSNKHNFDLQWDVKLGDSPYDYRSIMHYDKHAFAKDMDLVTMEAKDPYYVDLIGTGSGFSETDVQQLNELYKCPKYTGPFPPKPTPECHDNDPYCELTAMEGDCNDRWLKKYYRKLCPLSCGVCQIDPEATYPPLPASNPPPVCEDKASWCDLHKDKDCNAGKGGMRRFLMRHCAKTCKFCS